MKTPKDFTANPFSWRRAMNKDEVVKLMESSKSESEWNLNCDKVKKACKGYPDFWYEKVVLSGVMTNTESLW